MNPGWTHGQMTAAGITEALGKRRAARKERRKQLPVWRESYPTGPKPQRSDQPTNTAYVRSTVIGEISFNPQHCPPGPHLPMKMLKDKGGKGAGPGHTAHTLCS